VGFRWELVTGLLLIGGCGHQHYNFAEKIRNSMDIEKITNALQMAGLGDEHESLMFGAIGEKASNPKDIVGVRKAPMSTVSGAVLAELGVAMLEGASKYGRHNYRAVGVRASVYYDATMRHMIGWWEGQDIDPNSGMSHVIKAIASLVVLRDAMIQGKLTDDRAPRSNAFYDDLNIKAAAIIDKYADKNPKHYTIEDGQDAI
jgi:hypothetical protein